MNLAIQLKMCRKKSLQNILAALVSISMLLVASPVQGQKISRHWWNELKHWPNSSQSIASTITGAHSWSWNHQQQQQQQHHHHQHPLHHPVVSTAISAPAPIAPQAVYYHSTDAQLLQQQQQPIIRSADENSPSDDELMTQASRLNSQMIRKVPAYKSSEHVTPAGAYGVYRRAGMIKHNEVVDNVDQQMQRQLAKVAMYVDTPSKATAAAAAVPRARSNYYEAQPVASAARVAAASSRFSSFSPPHERETRFDDAPQTDHIWNYFDSTMNGKKPTSWREGNEFQSSRRRSDQVEDNEDIISRHFKRAANRRAAKPESPSSAGAATDKDGNTLKFNFSGRKKNPEEKAKWRQLVQSIFDNTPRSTDDHEEYGYEGYGGANGKTKLGGSSKLNEVFEDVTSTRTKARAAPEEEEELIDDRVDKEAAEELAQDKENLSDIPVDDTENQSGEEEEDVNNQYLHPNYTYKNSTATVSQQRKRSSEPKDVATATSSTTKRPHITLHLKVLTPTTTASSLDASAETTETVLNDNIDGDEEEEEVLEDVQETTTSMPMETTTTTLPVGRQARSFEENNTATTTDMIVELTTTISPFDEDLSRTKRKQHRIGSWVDRETLLFDDHNNNNHNHRRRKSTKGSRSVSEESSFDDRDMITKMIARKASVVINPARRTRQNAAPPPAEQAFDAEDSDVAALARTLPGTPGQDYGIFASVPKTSFNCRQQQWPGYYADVETKCQVFHICQQGGRRDSFLCPNGTMFNQQLFVCDWWHNVQCDEVASFYALNEHIHDQWESKRTSKECNDKAAAASAAVPETNRVRRMGDLKESTDNTNNSSSSTTTTGSSAELSTPSMATFAITDSVFGSRKAANEKTKRLVVAAAEPAGGLKGSASNTQFTQFSRLASATSANNKMSPFLVRYNYVSSHRQQQQQQPKTTAQVLTASGGSSSDAAATAWRGKYHRI